MKKINTIHPLIFIFLSMACSDLVIRDISTQDVSLIAPGDNISLDSGIVTFFWESVNHADNYSFQIVAGDFDAPDLLIIDTLINTTKLTLDLALVLDSGTFQWGVSAINSYYNTPYSVRTITISSRELSNGAIVLLFPTDDQTLSDSTFQFNWRDDSRVQEYIFKIIDYPKYSSVTENSFIIKAFENKDASYQWQVIGILEDNNQTISSPIYTFTITKTID
jgi:hypothetical protein